MSLRPIRPRKMAPLPPLPEIGDSCSMSRDVCPEHGYVHGAEAEELRKGIEKMLPRLEMAARCLLHELLDKVDARDSLAYLEAKGHRRTRGAK